MNEYDKTSIQINRCKRILALVDDYLDHTTEDNRTTLRKALMDEFEPPAIAPPVAAGSVDTESRKLAVKFDKEAREQRQRAEKAEARAAQLSSDLLAAHGDRDAYLSRALDAEARVAELEWKIADLDVQARDEEDRQAAHE